MQKSYRRDRAVILVVFAIWLALNPSYSAALVDFGSIHGTMHTLGVVSIFDNEFRKADDLPSVGITAIPGFRLLTGDYLLGLGAGAISIEKFVQHISLIAENKIADNIGQGQFLGSRIRHNSLTGISSSVSENIQAFCLDVAICAETGKESGEVNLMRFKGVVFLLADVL